MGGSLSVEYVYYDTPDFTPKWEMKNESTFHKIRPFELINQENESLKKINEAIAIIKIQEEDILLLQKSNEETEAAMQAGLPGLNELKLKLLEANNTIARFKGQVESKEKVFRNSDNS